MCIRDSPVQIKNRRLNLTELGHVGGQSSPLLLFMVQACDSEHMLHKFKKKFTKNAQTISETADVDRYQRAAAAAAVHWRTSLVPLSAPSSVVSCCCCCCCTRTLLLLMPTYHYQPSPHLRRSRVSRDRSQTCFRTLQLFGILAIFAQESVQ